MYFFSSFSCQTDWCLYSACCGGLVVRALPAQSGLATVSRLQSVERGTVSSAQWATRGGPGCRTPCTMQWQVQPANMWACYWPKVFVNSMIFSRVLLRACHCPWAVIWMYFSKFIHKALPLNLNFMLIIIYKQKHLIWSQSWAAADATLNNFWYKYLTCDKVLIGYDRQNAGVDCDNFSNAANRLLHHYYAGQTRPIITSQK